MDHIRRTLSLGLLALVSVLGTWACNNGNKTVKFAAVLPLTGDFEAYGTAIKRGIDLAFEDAKAQGSMPFPIELTVHDSASDPAKAAQLLEQAIDEGAVGTIGGVTSDEALRMVEIADSEDRVLLSPSASSPDLSGVSRNFYRVFPSDLVEGRKMGDFAANTIELETAVVLAAESTFGRGIHGVFETEFSRHGGEVLDVLEFPVNTSDFSGLVERVMTLKPDGVYIAAFWDDTVEIISALKKTRFKGKILTTAAFATPRAIAKAGDDAEGVYFTQTVFDISSAGEPIRGFVERYRSRYGEDPDLYAAHGFDAALVLLEAARQTDGVAADLWKGMRSIQALPGVTGAIQFDEKGDVPKWPRVYLIKDGEPIYYEAHVREVKEAFRQRLQELEEQQRKLKAN